MSVSEEAHSIAESGDVVLLRARLGEISHDRDKAWASLKELQTAYAALENRSGMPVCTPEEYETLVHDLEDARWNLGAARDAADASQIILSEVQARLSASQTVLFETQRERAQLADRWEAGLREWEARLAMPPANESGRDRIARLEPDPETTPEVAATGDAFAALREDLADASARIAAFDAIRDRLYDTYLRCAGERDEARAALAVAARREQEGTRELERARDESHRLKDSVAKLQDHVLALDAMRERNAGLLNHLADAQSISAAAVASLEKTRLQLEFELATRVGSAEARAARYEGAHEASALERAMLVEALGLREERVALLESTVRRIARETIAATEADLERYRAMHQSLLASKLFALRRWADGLVRARVWPRRSTPKRANAIPVDTGAGATAKRPRHLRSA